MVKTLLIGLAIINTGVVLCAPVAGEPWAIYVAILLGMLLTGVAVSIGNRSNRLGCYIIVGLFAIAASVGTVIGGKALRVHLAPVAAGIAASAAPRAVESFQFDFSDAAVRVDLGHGELYGSRADGWTLRCVYPIVDRDWQARDPVPAWAMRTTDIARGVPDARISLRNCPVGFTDPRRPYGFRIDLDTARTRSDYAPVVRKALATHQLSGAAGAPMLTVHQGRFTTTGDLILGGGMVGLANLLWLLAAAGSGLAAPRRRSPRPVGAR